MQRYGLGGWGESPDSPEWFLAIADGRKEAHVHAALRKERTAVQRYGLGGWGESGESPPRESAQYLWRCRLLAADPQKVIAIAGLETDNGDYEEHFLK
ncbi:MAG: hypothetical protein PHI18_03000 [bacterium]|nr:hypothetical protein [bacterium]